MKNESNYPNELPDITVPNWPVSVNVDEIWISSFEIQPTDDTLLSEFQSIDLSEYCMDMNRIVFNYSKSFMRRNGGRFCGDLLGLREIEDQIEMFVNAKLIESRNGSVLQIESHKHPNFFCFYSSLSLIFRLIDKNWFSIKSIQQQSKEVWFCLSRY